VPFVFLAAVAAASGYLVRFRRTETSSQALDVCSPTAIRFGSGSRTRLVGIRGWLLLYIVGLAAELAHGLALTIGSLVIYAKPSLDD
jgi:urease beta subunit